MVEAACGLLDRSNLGGSFEIGVGGIGGFPKLEKPRVIWTGINGDIDKLNKLLKMVESCACRCGVARDLGKFSPHITLGRCGGSAPLAESTLQMIKEDEISLPSWRVEEIIMMKSELTCSGPIYTPLKIFKL